MPSEFEELKLTVTLVDNASTGIERLRQQLEQLGGGKPASGMDKLKDLAKDAGEAIKGLGSQIGEMTKGLGVAGNAMLAFGTRVAVVGTELYEQAQKLKEWSEQIVHMTNAAQMMGVSYAEFRNVSEQMEQYGISTGEAATAVAGLNHAIADMLRPASQIRVTLMSHAWSDEAGMSKFIEDLTTATTQVDRLNVAREAGNNVYIHALAETGSHIEANNRRQMLFQTIGLPAQFANVPKELENMTKAQAQRWNEMSEHAKNYNAMTVRIAGDWGKINDIFKDQWLRPGSPFMILMDLAEAGTHAILETTIAIDKAWSRMTTPPKWVTDIISKIGESEAGQAALSGAKQGAAQAGSAMLPGPLQPIGQAYLRRYLQGQRGSESERETRNRLAGGGGTMPNSLDIGQSSQLLRGYSGTAPATQATHFAGSGNNAGSGKFWENWTRSTNIEDRRNEKQTDVVDENTKQLTQLNDNIYTLLEIGPYKGRGLGGGGDMLGGGGTDGGGGTGTGTSDGKTDDGTTTGPKSAVPETNVGPPAKPWPTGAVPDAMDPFKSDNVGKPALAWPGEAGGGTEGATAAASHGGSAYLAKQRAAIFAKIAADPRLRAEVAATLGHEGSTKEQAQATLESLVNRMVYKGTTDVLKELDSGFYGPRNRTGRKGFGALGAPNKGLLQAYDWAAERVSGGSDVIGMRTDQGTWNKEVFQGVKGGINVAGEGYADWGNAARSRRWREQQERDKAAYDATHPAGEETAAAPPAATANIPGLATTGITIPGTSGPASSDPNAPPQGRNVFQRRGVDPNRFKTQRIATAYGPIDVPPEAAGDIKAFWDDVKKLGAPIKKLGSKNIRKMRRGSAWSSHSYGAAQDIDDAAELSPAMKKWIQDHPDEWAKVLRDHNMSQPYPSWDAPHIEWTGPKKGDPSGVQDPAHGPVQIPNLPFGVPGAPSAFDDRTSRKTIDTQQGKEITQKISGEGKVDVNFKGGYGGGDTTSSTKLLKPEPVERQSQMVPAREGPVEETVSGVGHN